MANIRAAVDRVTANVRDACLPDNMTQYEAIEFLEGVIDNLTMDLDALREETK